MEIDLTYDAAKLRWAVEQMIQNQFPLHVPHKQNEEQVVKSQKQMLGAFYRPFPYGSLGSDLNLAMIGQVGDNQPMTTTGNERTFEKVIENDQDKLNHSSVVTMVARSGSGKTASVVSLARKHFVIYTTCTIERQREDSEFVDINFRRLAGAVTEECEKLEKMYQRDAAGMTIDELMKFDAALFRYAMKRIQLEFLARHLFLLFLFVNNKQLTPENFFHEQMNGGVSTIERLVHNLHKYTESTISWMLTHVYHRLRPFLGSRALVIVLDEAHIAENDILQNKLISRTGLHALGRIQDTDRILDDNTDDSSIGDMKLRDIFDDQGFLTPLRTALAGVPATLVVLGTTFSLKNVEQVYSAICKPNNRLITISDFPICDEDGVSDLLSKLIDMTDCEIQPARKRRLVGRFRFTTYVLSALAATGVHKPNMSKQQILEEAIDKAIEKAKKDIKIEVDKLMSNVSHSDIHLLSRMVIAFKLGGGRVIFAEPTEADFVNHALCAVRQEEDRYSFWIDEPLVSEVVEDVLKERKINPEFNTYLKHLNSIYTDLGTNSSARGGILKHLVGETFKLFHGTPLQELPFLKKIKNKLPKWCKETTLQVRKLGTAKELGYSDGLRGDMEYFEDPRLGELLYPNHNTRPDGTLLTYKDIEGFQGWVTFAMKFESTPLDSKTNRSNDRSCDPRLCFLENLSLKEVRKSFEDLGYPDKMNGVLRIHLVFPSIQGGTPESYVKGNDVFIYIDCLNMDTFFDGNRSMNGETKILKDMIEYVITSKKDQQAEGKTKWQREMKLKRKRLLN